MSGKEGEKGNAYNKSMWGSTVIQQNDNKSGSIFNVTAESGERKNLGQFLQSSIAHRKVHEKLQNSITAGCRMRFWYQR